MASSSEQPSIHQPSVEPLSDRIVQNFLVVWVDQHIDDDNIQYKESMKLLRKVVNTIKTFTSAEQCIDFITRNKTERILLIASGTLGQKTVPAVHDMVQVTTIYIFCINKAVHEEWTKKYSKIKSVSTSMPDICNTLENVVRKYDRNIIPISFLHTTSEAMNKNFDQFDQPFVYIQVLKEVLLTMKFGKADHTEFLAYSRQQFTGNKIELGSIDKFEKYYSQQRAINWYTHPGFISSMLNRALYKLEFDLIMKLSFFIRDLHEYITQRHIEQNAGQTHPARFTAYRGQGLSKKDFHQLEKLQGGLLLFNSFLSASKSREVALNLALEAMENPDLVGVLFEMRIESSMPSAAFADIHGPGHDQRGDDILFSMQSIFRIGEIKKSNDHTSPTHIKLILVNENDPQLRALTERIQEETYSDAKGWYRLGDLSMKLNQFDKARQIFEILLNQKDDNERAGIYYKLGMIKERQEKYKEAIAFYEQSMNTNKKILPPTHPDLCSAHSALGQMYAKTGELPTALQHLERARDIQQKILPPNHPDLTALYTHLGNIYNKTGDYMKALQYHENARKIYENTLPSHHPDLVTAYYNVANTYNLMGDYAKAKPLLEQAVNKSQNIPAPNIPDIEKWRKDLESMKDKL